MSERTLRVLGKRGRITVPLELRKAIGLAYNDVVSFRLEGDTVRMKREKLCDNCPGNGPAQEFLGGLSPEEQRQALIHLSVRWAEKEGQ